MWICAAFMYLKWICEMTAHCCHTTHLDRHRSNYWLRLWLLRHYWLPIPNLLTDQNEIVVGNHTIKWPSIKYTPPNNIFRLPKQDTPPHLTHPGEVNQARCEHHHCMFCRQNWYKEFETFSKTEFKISKTRKIYKNVHTGGLIFWAESKMPK